MKIHKRTNKNEQKEQLRAGLILRLPHLFDDVKKSVDQIYALINTYIARKNYQVIKSGFNAIYSVVFRYIDIRNGTFFPSSIIQAYDFSSDTFLNDVFEKLAAIQRVASKEKDLELSKEIIDCFSKIAIKCTEIRYRTTMLSEYTHCMLAVQYMQQSIEDSLNSDLLDIGIQGSQSQKNIGLVLISKNAHTDIRMILENLSKIAIYGIAKPKATFLISHPLQAYSLFLRAFMFNKEVYDDLLPRSILEKVQGIIDMYLKFKDLGISHISVDLQYSLGDFIDLSKPIAMPYIFEEAYAKIADKKTNKEERENLIDKILDFGHQIWHFYDELSKSAAEKESFLIHFIDSNLSYISLNLLKLYQSNELEEYQKEKVLEDIGWIISDYWRIYDYHKKITGTYEMEMLENLLRIGYEFNKLSLIEELDEIIDIIVSIAESFLEKQEDSYGFDPIRILEKALYLCVLSGSDGIKDKFITRVKDKFWKNFLEKYPQRKNLLFEELSTIEPEKLRLNKPDISFEDNLLCQLDKADIDKFVKSLKERLGKQNLS